MKIFLEILGICAVTLGPVWIVAGLWIAALSKPVEPKLDSLLPGGNDALSR